MQTVSRGRRRLSPMTLLALIVSVWWICVSESVANGDKHDNTSTGKPPGWEALMHKAEAATPPPVSYNYTGWQPGSNDLSLDDPLVAMVVDKSTPEQIRLTLGANVDTILVVWTTGAGFNFSESYETPSTPLQTKVLYGLSPNALDHTAEGVQDAYVFNNTGYVKDPKNNFFISGSTHVVELKKLSPETVYYYKCGDPDVAMSSIFSFKTGKTPSSKAFPVTFALTADVGQTTNSSWTLQQLAAHKHDVTVHVGDVAYADNYSAEGCTDTIYYTPVGDIYNETSPPQPMCDVITTYQPRWDTFGRLISNTVNTSSVPYMPLVGDHEVEVKATGNNVPFKSFLNRYPTPYEESESTNQLYYSWNYGGVHVVMVGAFEQEGEYNFTSQITISQTQIDWLIRDLKTVNRLVTPWVVAMIHTPWYNSFQAHFKEVECFQQQIEDILYEYGVDMVFSGHTHAYERCRRTYKFEHDACAPTYVTVGDGGNIEGLSKPTIDMPDGRIPFCDTPPNSSYPYCATFERSNGIGQGSYYCPTEQPLYSAFRESAFGYGYLEFVSATEVKWSWYKWMDGNIMPSDSVTVTKDMTCPNQLKSLGQTAINTLLDPKPVIAGLV